ncbi:MAG: sugar ABC transporter permease [Clostridia bacterium]|nr:sugar ABC transporter permease [Clostridia bacterium]MBO5206112.1 sugar ABC transporter permease [Clostridia bacterium]MBP3582653.1 sugar ABC transporter permease [Clostridia bacterium]MBQ8584604.1 sugar ABC transporter permease [Clostridia bacterium]
MIDTSILILGLFLLAFGGFAVYDLATAKRRREVYRVKSTVTAYLMLLPAVLLAFLFVLLPILYSLGYAFTDYYLLKPNDISFVKLENFVEIIEEISEKGMLYNAIKNTLTFVIGVVPLQIGLALLLALFVNRPCFGSKIFKVCFFAPVVISLSVTSFLWLQILAPGEGGLLNSLLGMFGIPPHDWLRDPETAMPCIIVLSAWQGCGYQMLIFLSGLSNIRKDLYEAASLDGASRWHQFWNVTWVGLRSTFVYILITVFIGACRILTQPMLMTGYMSHTVTLSYYMYNSGYTKRLVGESSAVALLMTIFIGGITLIQRRLFREK